VRLLFLKGDWHEMQNFIHQDDLWTANDELILALDDEAAFIGSMTR
jgi:hypothetical protein